MRDEQRIAAIKRLGLLNMVSIPILEEVTQMAARFLHSPICILTLIVNQEVWIKAAFGLSSLGLMNPLATSRTMSRQDAICTHVVDSQQPLSIEDTFTHPVLVTSNLVQKYKIRSYLGVPLITREDQCIGALAVMDLQTSSYSEQYLEYLLLLSRWCLQELELNNSWQTASRSGENQSTQAPDFAKLQILYQFGQELRNPLTSIVGMTSVLVKGVFGSLTPKQKEYLDIIHASSQNLNILLDELLNLTILQPQNESIKLSLVNLEMLCQKVIQGLTPIACRKLQTLHYSTESLDIVSPLDKDKIYQALYFLIFNILTSSPAESTIKIILSCSQEKVVIFVDFPSPNLAHPENNYPYLEEVEIALSHSLITLHGGTIIREKLSQNDRYIISLPKLHDLTEKAPELKPYL